MRRIGTWILAAAVTSVVAGSGVARAQEEGAGFVGLTAGGEERPFTLSHTEIAGDIGPGFARIVLTQTWENPFEEPLEGVYRFPLPHDAAVDRVAMIVGDRLIEAQVMEREEARETYEQARDEGHHAALTEEERPNVFTQSVANVMPGEAILVTLRFVAPLVLVDGEYVLALPTVVGPRYVPQHAQGDPGMARINPAVLPEGEVGGHRLDVSLRIRPGLSLLGVSSPSHSINVESQAPDDATVTLDPDDRIPNKDVVLRYRVASRTPGAGFLAHKTGEWGTFALSVEPPMPDAGAPVAPRELVFVVDTSGSMMGEPIEKAKAVMRHALRNLGPDDAFQIVNFSNEASSLSPVPLPSTKEAVRRGLDYVDRLSGEGGTEMLSGIRAALAGTPERGRLRLVLFMTDGYIGNDDEVLAYVRKNIGQARLFSLGVGSSVNRYLLDRLAELGRGAVEVVTPYEGVEEAVERFYARIGAPVLTDVRVSWGGLAVSDVSPEPVPDLFLGQPLRLLGRYRKAGSGTVVIEGRMGDKPVKLPVSVALPAREAANELLETVWAKREVERLVSLELGAPTPEQQAEILRLGLAHHLLTPYTSMVAVERDVVTNPSPDELRTALAAVMLPDGVERAGIFGEAREPALLTPDRIMPGDPDIFVHAPKDARRVLAVLPWGEPVECFWVETEGAWMGRFLVPREAAEGLYRIRVFVEASDGATNTYTLLYRVDFTAPTMELEVDREVLDRGGVLGLRAVPVEGVYEGKAVRTVGGVVVRVRTDVKVASARIGGAVVELAQSRLGDAWTGALAVPSDLVPGEHEVELVVIDYAGNAHSTVRKVVVR